MPSSEGGDLSAAIIHYLRCRGIPIQPVKTSPASQEHNTEAPLRGAVFGVPLHALPISEHVEGVPQFLVDACELLRSHLHIEGLFRKCGSLTRIRALKKRLEAGEHCLEMALPCDIATLVKEFLRGLPEPLIPAWLQGPLCQTQEQGEEPDCTSLALLLTCLLPPRNTNTLRYLFCFLQDVAARCAQNKMDLPNLAVIFAPNLFPAEDYSQLCGQAEGQLQKQAAVLQVLIGHAPEIGTVPQPLLEKVQAAFSDLESKRRQPATEQDNLGGKTMEGRRRRRRSMGNIVTEALSKFKTGRTLSVAPGPEIKADSLGDTTRKTSSNAKRKASDDVAWTTELSTKKRRSGLESSISDSFDRNGGDPFAQPGELNPAQVLSTSDPVFSSNSTPTLDARPDIPRALPVKVQRRRSSGRKYSQRKHSGHASPCCSPTPLERKKKRPKSLSIFSHGSKELVHHSDPHPTSAKDGDPSSWLWMKKMVTEVLEGPTSQEGCAQVKPHKQRETERGSPNQLSSRNICTPACRNPDVSHAVGSDMKLNALSDGVNSTRQEVGMGAQHGGKELQDQSEPFAVEAIVLPALPTRRVLRRSLSWPEDLSMKNAAERREMGFFPDEATLDPRGREGQMSGLLEPTQPPVEGIMAGSRLGIVPEVYMTLGDSYETRCPENGPSNLPQSPSLSRADVPNGPTSPEDHPRHLNAASQSALKRLTLCLQRISSSRSNQGSSVVKFSSPKRKEGRRFRRSVSHESGLPLQAGQKVPSGQAAQRTVPEQPPQSPLQAFRACGRQICTTRKQILMSFASMRKRNVQSPTQAELPKTTFLENQH